MGLPVRGTGGGRKRKPRGEIPDLGFLDVAEDATGNLTRSLIYPRHDAVRNWCGGCRRPDSNWYELALRNVSSFRICQFRHAGHHFLRFDGHGILTQAQQVSIETAGTKMGLGQHCNRDRPRNTPSRGGVLAGERP